MNLNAGYPVDDMTTVSVLVRCVENPYVDPITGRNNREGVVRIARERLAGIQSPEARWLLDYAIKNSEGRTGVRMGDIFDKLPRI
ncbi:MAG: hypothetical protein HYW25_02585 [Candidatus Aenigmarchaeota archaeon]|nr:hypothetical protein [Candidatus Aenigmarchaeota archaeon]